MHGHTTCAAAAALLGLFGLAANAQSHPIPAPGQVTHPARGTTPMPPAGHTAQWWTHPLGCEYSRAGRPGETVWFLIINTRRPGCPGYIVQSSPYNDVY